MVHTFYLQGVTNSWLHNSMAGDIYVQRLRKTQKMYREKTTYIKIIYLKVNALRGIFYFNLMQHKYKQAGREFC